MSELYTFKHFSVLFKCCSCQQDRQTQQKLGVPVSKPLCTWTKQSFTRTKQSSVFHTQEQSSYHQDIMARMLAFKETYDQMLQHEVSTAC